MYKMMLGDIGNLWVFIFDWIMTCSHNKETLIDNRNIYGKSLYYKKHISSCYNKEVVKR